MHRQKLCSNVGLLFLGDNYDIFQIEHVLSWENSNYQWKVTRFTTMRLKWVKLTGVIIKSVEIVKEKDRKKDKKEKKKGLRRVNYINSSLDNLQHSLHMKCLKPM